MIENRYRTFREFEEEYLRNHPEEIDDYITVLFKEYAESGDATALFTSLRLIDRIKGETAIAESSGLSRKEVQKALSENGKPQFGSVNAMSYHLVPQKI